MVQSAIRSMKLRGMRFFGYCILENLNTKILHVVGTKLWVLTPPTSIYTLSGHPHICGAQCAMVPYYSIWSVEQDEEGKNIKMVIFIKNPNVFQRPRGRCFACRPLYTIFVVKIPRRTSPSHTVCGAVLNLSYIEYSHEYNVQLRVPKCYM
jgi:hypothetical protein